MKITLAEFITSIGDITKYKDYSMPEITFVGRSNVGKSSLINALTNYKKLAKTSSLAGRTRLVNLFLINKKFILVDLPGYGYAKAGKEAQQEWQGLIEGYLQKSKQLKMVFVLVDIRIKPTEQDKQMINYLYYYNMPFKVVATKADKIGKSQIKPYLANIANELGLGIADIFAVSAQTKYGLDEVLSYMDNVLDYDNLVANVDLIDKIKEGRREQRVSKQSQKNTLTTEMRNKKSNVVSSLNKNSKNSINSKNTVQTKNNLQSKNKLNSNKEKTNNLKSSKNDNKTTQVSKPKKIPRYILKKRKRK